MNPEKREDNKEELPMIEMPENFKVCYGFDESVAKSGLVKAYQEVFVQPPWNEKWSEQEVLEKMKRETDLPGSVTVLMKGKDGSVQGFSWGRILETKDLEKEVEPALGLTPVGLNEEVAKKAEGRLFYFHEIAVLPQVRAGLNPARFLARPGIEMACREGISQNLFWTTPESKIVHATSPFGYEPIFECSDSHGHQILFLFNPNHKDFLDALMRHDQKKLARFKAGSH